VLVLMMILAAPDALLTNTAAHADLPPGCHVAYDGQQLSPAEWCTTSQPDPIICDPSLGRGGRVVAR